MPTSDTLVSAGVRIVVTCPNCGGCADAVVSEMVHRGELRWNFEQCCQNCGERTASHNAGLAPEPFRAALLANGQFLLSIRSPDMKANAWKALRAAFNLSISEAKEMWGALVSGRSGTEVEMQHLRMILEGAGLVVEVKRAARY